MRIRKLSVWCVLSVCLLVSGCMSNRPIKFGTGNGGGMYYNFGAMLKERLAEQDIDVEVMETAGSAANIRLISRGFVQLALSQSDLLYDAAEKIGEFEGKDYAKGYGAIGALYTEACQIVVPEDSPVKSVSDLSGLRVSIGVKESGVIKNAEEILLAYGMTTEMIKPEYLSFRDSANALSEGNIDAFFYTASAPVSALTELASKMDIRILSIDEETQKKIRIMHHGYVSTTIPANTYPGQSEPISTVGVKSVLLAANSMDKETVAQITRFLAENRKELTKAAKVIYEEDLSFVTEDIACGIHAGAAEVFQEMGIDVKATENSGHHTITAHQD